MKTTRFPRLGATMAVLSLVALGAAGCATLQGVAALRRVEFDLDRVSDVRLAGVDVSNKRSWSDVSPLDIARLGAAVLLKDVPLDATVHVRGDNPPDNDVEARLLRMDWTFFLEDRELVDGRLDEEYVFPPGRSTDIPIRVRFDMYDKVGGQARDLFELALAISGRGDVQKDVRLDILPEIDTPVGRMRYPQPITIHKTVGGR